MEDLTRWPRRVFIGSLLASSAAIFVGAAEPARSYKTGYSSIMKLGRDLHAALKPEQRKKIAPQPISIETDNHPFVRHLVLNHGSEEVRGVWISAGFIDLVNHVAHAQAIDARAKEYLRKYVELLEAGGVPELPDSGEARYWSDEVLNEQQSNFNSIVAVIVGTKLANHYLGHLAGTAEGEQVSVEEWREALLQGVRNALRAGCMTEGAIPFFAEMDRMKARPAWVADFIHPKAKFSEVRKEMEELQRRFLAGAGE